MSFASQAGQWTLLAPILPVVVDAAVKSALVLIAAGVAVGCMRKCSAAARHLVWFLAVASLPLLPALSLALPGWHILPRSFNVQPTTTAQRIAPATEAVPAPSPPQSSAGAVAPAEGEARIEPQEFQSTPVSPGERSKFKSPMPSSAASTPLPARPFNLPAFVLPLWIAGAMLTLLPTALGLFSLWRLERTSRRETASSWLELLRQLVERLNFRRAVALLKTDRRRMPMTWGIFRPKLLLPEESHEWPAERRSVVLLHELAHAKRWDYLTNLVTQFVCALYWFNPLVWFAARQMIAERERACDDIVLRQGARPADYAEQILQIAAGLRLERFAGYGGIAMARASKLEGRLLAILDSSRNRATVTRTIAAAAVVLLAAVVIPMAMIKAQSPSTPLPTTAVSPERKGNLEELKRFLSSPPPLEYALYYVTNDPASRFRLSSPTRQKGTVAAESSIDIFEGSWCNGNFWTRRLGPGSTSPLGPVSGAFMGRSGDTYWHVVGSTVFKETVREREPEFLGPIGYAYPARPGEEQFLRILTLGIPVAKPGTFQFDGNRFVVDREGGPKAHGELLVTNGWVTGIRLDELGFDTYWIFEFTYDRHRDQLPWFFPSEITQTVYRKTDEFTKESFHTVFLKVQIADRELPPGRFLSDGIVVPAGATNLLAGLTSPNRAYFLVGPGGQLVQTNSQVFFPGQGGGAPFESVGEAKAGLTNARPFIVKGRVTDPQGNGIAGVTITAHCGMGTLFPTGETNTDATGHYTLHFREGMKGFDESSGQWRVALQAATISPRKAGWFETNLYRGGDLLMADRLPAPDENVGWKLDPSKVVLPNRPYELNFVMQPAARIIGQLSDEFERPMARTKIWIDGELPPSSSVLAETETDDAGRFRFEDVPTGYFWNFHIASAAGMSTRFESPGELSLYLRVRESRGRKVLGPVAPPGEAMNADTPGGTSTADWGEESVGLRTRVWAKTNVFRAGQSIQIQLEVTNVSEQLKSFHTPAAPWNHGLTVLDARGNPVPYIAGSAQVGVSPIDLGPHRSVDAKGFDLTDYYYVRSPGRYTVTWLNEILLPHPGDRVMPLPASAPFSFEVVADPAANADGDPIGRLLPLLRDKWSIGTGGSRTNRVRPGSNHEEVAGRLLTLQYNPTGLKKDSGLVWLWLTDEVAAEQPATGDWPPPSDYLGRLSRWHVYFYASTNALRAWPTVREDVRRALGTEAPPGGDRAATAVEFDTSTANRPTSQTPRFAVYPSTNPPVVYPAGMAVAELVREVLEPPANNSVKAGSPAEAPLRSVRERVEQLIRDAPVTTNFDLEIFQPGARNAFAVRSNVVQLAYYNEGGLDSNSVFGMVYHLPAQNRFYIGWDAFRLEPRHYYGPFTGNPFEVLSARSGNAWEQNAHRPDPKRVEPDNPLGLDNDTIISLFNTGQKLQQVAQLAARQSSRQRVIAHSADELFARYINRDELSADPFARAPLHFEMTGDKVRVWSVGPDGEWNDGALTKPDDPDLKGDVGVEMEAGKNDIHWLAQGAVLDYLQGKHTARYLAKQGKHYPVHFPLPERTDEKLKFGPSVDGLRAAVELTTRDGRFVFGQPIDVRVHIRNEADYAIQIASGSWRNEDRAIIEDEQGKTRPTGHIMYTGLSPQVRIILKPGETATFQSSSLEFFTEENAQSANAVRYPVGYTATLKPGKCTVRFRLRLPGWNAQLMDWRGELETGPVVLDLKPLSEASTGPAMEDVKSSAFSAFSAVKSTSDSP